MNAILLMAVNAFMMVADDATDSMDQMLFYVMIALWVIMPLFIVYEEMQERKALREAEEATASLPQSA